MIEGFRKKPDNYKKKIDQIITLISANIDSTKEGIEILQELISETEKLSK